MIVIKKIMWNRFFYKQGRENTERNNAKSEWNKLKLDFVKVYQNMITWISCFDFCTWADRQDFGLEVKDLVSESVVG